MSFLDIFHITYYFDKNINPIFPGFWVVVAAMGLILVLTIVLNLRFNKLVKKASKDQKIWWSNWLNIGYTVSITELVWLFFRNQTISYFNWRFWPTLLTLGVIGWAGWLIYYRRRVVPKELAEKATQKSLAYYFRKRRK